VTMTVSRDQSCVQLTVAQSFYIKWFVAIWTSHSLPQG
jgi:hypothetical protein